MYYISTFLQSLVTYSSIQGPSPNAHLEPDIGTGECQPCDGRVEHRCGGVLARRDADGPGRLLSQHIEMGEFRFDALKVWDDRAEQAFPSLGRRDAAGRRARSRRPSRSSRPRIA